MRLHGLTVCVDYSDFLALSIGRWVRGLDSLTIITTPQDIPTHALSFKWSQQYSAEHCDLGLHVTDAFTKDGASFNKGLAMEEARAFMPWEDWILFFDADIVPQVDWYQGLEQWVKRGYLHGAPRLDAQGPSWIDDPSCPLIPDDRVGYGYFQLFHSQDPPAQQSPLLSIHWRHAGNYDSDFLLSWPSARELPIRLWHVGTRGNWFGRGHKSDFQSLMQTRDGKGIHPSEKL